MSEVRAELVDGLEQALRAPGTSEESVRNVAHYLARLDAPRQGSVARVLENGRGEVPLGGRTPRFRFLTDEEVLSQKPPGQLVTEIFTKGGLGALIGPSGDGKTFLVIDWLVSVAHSGAWIGGRRAESGLVVLVAAEGSYSLGPRVRACKELCEAEGSIPLHTVPQPVNLMDAGEVAVFLAELEEALRELPAWIVFDTLAQSMVGGDENTAKDMGVVIQNCNRIRQATGSAVLLVHHTGHNSERERGSTALRAGVDTMLMLKKNEEGVLVFSCLKQKDMAAFSPIRLQLNETSGSLTIGPIWAMDLRAPIGKPHSPAREARSCSTGNGSMTRDTWNVISLEGGRGTAFP